jgi:hypothetical protein
MKVTSINKSLLCIYLFLYPSRLFWVSSLAYPNLLGTKGYVVVVVVVVVVVGEGYLKTLVIMLSVVNIGLQSTEQLSL